MALAVGLLVLAFGESKAQPAVDHHQHLFSPAIGRVSPRLTPLGASELVERLDATGIQRAIVLSLAYQYGNPNNPPVEDEYTHVKAENDWTSEQVALFPARLQGFCSVDPLADYALEEVARCARDPQLRFGLKLHFGNSDVDLDNAQHVQRARRVFEAANDRAMAIVVHLRTSVTRQRPYGAQQARVFINEILSAARDVPVQIAHLAGAGGYDDPAIDAALEVFADALANRDPRMARVYFDVSGVAGLGNWTEKAALIASRIRELGAERIVYGSDGAPDAAWKAFRELPLTDAEFRAIEGNLAPYMQ